MIVVGPGMGIDLAGPEGGGEAHTHRGLGRFVLRCGLSVQPVGE